MRLADAASAAVATETVTRSGASPAASKSTSGVVRLRSRENYGAALQRPVVADLSGGARGQERLGSHRLRRLVPTERGERLAHAQRQRGGVIAALQYHAERYVELFGELADMAGSSRQTRRPPEAPGQWVVAVSVEAGGDQHEIGLKLAAGRQHDVLDQRKPQIVL